MPMRRRHVGIAWHVVAACAVAALAAPASAQSEGEPEGDAISRLLQDLARASASLQSQEQADEQGDGEQEQTGDDADVGEQDETQNLAPNRTAGAGRDVAAEDLARLEREGAVEVDDFERVDIHVVQEDLATVLRLLSIEAERNIVVSKAVSATITADIYDAGFYDALEAILKVNGLGYVERGDFLYVYTEEEIQQVRTRETPPTSRIIELEYLNAVEAVKFATPLLSEIGVVQAPAEPPEFQIPDDVPVGKDDYASGAVLVVYDYPENVERVAGLIADLDVRPVQVLVEATILQAEITEANAFGVDFSVLADLDFADFTSPLSTVGQLLGGDSETELGTNGQSVSSTVGNTSGASGLRVGILDSNAAVFVRALDEVTDVTLISKPKLLTLNRQPARVLVGTRVGFLNSTTTTDTATVQEVDFLNTGTQLRVRPFVTKDGRIRLELKPQVSDATLRETTTPDGALVTIPDEDTTELVTNLIMRDGQTAVLGGLFTEDTASTRRQVPFLGDIPVLGAPFRGQDDNVVRSEIIFLITPTIIEDDTLVESGEAAERYVSRVRIGSRRGLLPWSRERQVGRLLVEAERHMEAGDRREALLRVERALTLAPSSADARTLRAELLDGETIWPSRSIFDDILPSAPPARSTPDRRPAVDPRPDTPGSPAN